MSSPTVLSVSIAVNDIDVTVVMSEAVTVGADLWSGLQVNGKSLAYVSGTGVGGSPLRFVSSVPIGSGARTAAYTQPGDGIQNTNGDLLASFSGRSTNPEVSEQRTVSLQFNAGAAELGRKDQPNGYSGLDSNGVLIKGLANVRQFGAVGSGSSDDSTALQSLVSTTETSGQSHVYFPTFSDNYLVASDLTFNLGDNRIFGDSGIIFAHPFVDATSRLMRQGWLVGAITCDAILDLGDYVTKASGSTTPYPSKPARNQAQSWTVDHLALRGEGTKEVDGIAFTGQQNGPHRIISVDTVSGYNLRYGVYVPPPAAGITINIANLRIENSSFCFGEKAIFSEGYVYGASIESNNFEANTSGCVWGGFNGAISIVHNMMENTANPVNLTPVANLSVVAHGNYFEYHPTSDYLYRVVGYDSHMRYNMQLAGDIISGPIPTWPVTLTNAGRWRINVAPVYPILIKEVYTPETFCVSRGNNLLAANGKINVDRITGAVVVDVTGGFNRPDLTDVALHSYPHDPTNTTLEETPLGPMQVVDLYDGIRVPHPENIQNKLVVSTFMIRSEPGIAIAFPPATIRARTYAAGYINGPNAPLDYIANDMSQGEWRMVCCIWKGTSNVQNVEFYALTAGQFKVAGVVTQVLGSYVGDGSDGIKSIAPYTLNRKIPKDSYTLAAGTTVPAIRQYATTLTTANSSATTISNMTGHTAGQSWLLFIADANTTIACAGGTGTNLINAAGASNISPANGDYIRCTSLDGTKIHCQLIDLTP